MQIQTVATPLYLARTRSQTSSPRSISRLERIRLGGIEQWIRIQGKDTSNPVLLLIQQGPGLPMVNEAADNHKLWHLEEDFVVVYWDQRACGKSFRSTISPESMTLDQLIADTRELILALCQRFQVAQLYLTGFSFGGTLAALVAARYPELIRAVVCINLDVKWNVAEQVAYDFALERARSLNHKQALRELQRLGPPPHLDSKAYNTRVKWVSTFGGVNRHANYRQIQFRIVGQMIRSRDYSLLDVIRTLRGQNFVLDQLLSKLASFNLFELLPRLEVPVVLLQGRHDMVAPVSEAEQFYQQLHAPKGKQFIWFEESAHELQYEEPGKFRDVMLTVKQQCEESRAHE
jgi:pimeloyl-ACP methyl ester carboxylesterase